MDPDLALVLGLIVGAFAIPSILSAITDGRAPRASVLTILIAFALILFALVQKPGGYTLSEIPHAFVTVAGRYLH